MPRWVTALNFVIPTGSKRGGGNCGLPLGHGECVVGEPSPGSVFPSRQTAGPSTTLRSVEKHFHERSAEPQVPRLRSDDKVEGSAPMESSCCMRAVFHLLGWADGP